MMHVLLESAPVHAPRRAGWTAVSFFTHGSLIAAAVALTAGVAAPPPPAVEVIRTIYRPPTPATPPVTRPPVVTAPVVPTFTMPDIPALPVVPFNPRIVPTDLPPSTGIIGSIIGPPVQPQVVSPDGVATSDQVERIVVPRANNPRPLYPNALKNAMVEGDVSARFIVDTTGRVERNSIEIISTTHSLFADAVREWLPRTRYEPATINGRRVRQLVEQRVGFALQR